MAYKFDFSSLEDPAQPAPLTPAPRAQSSGYQFDFSSLEEPRQPRAEEHAVQSAQFEQQKSGLDEALSWMGSTARSWEMGAARSPGSIGYLVENFLSPSAQVRGITGAALSVTDALGADTSQFRSMLDTASDYDPVAVGGRMMQHISKQSAQWWNDEIKRTDPSYHKAMEAPVLADDAKLEEPSSWVHDDFGLTTVIAGAAASANEMMLTAPAAVYGAVMARVAVKAGLPNLMKAAAGGSLRAKKLIDFSKHAEAAGAVAAGGMAEGSLAAGAAGLAAEDDVLSRSHEDLLIGSQRYRDVYASALEMPDEERRKYAQDTIAREAGISVARNVGLSTFLLGAPANAFFGKLGAKLKVGKGADDVGDGFLKTVAKGAGSEGAQETGQSGAESLLSNIGIRDYADASQDIYEGVANDMILGGLIGGVVGGGMGAAMYRGDGKEKKGKKGKPGDTQPAASPEIVAETGALITQLQESGADPAQVLRVLRWAGLNGVAGAAGGQSVIRANRALQGLLETGELPESVREAVQEDVNDGGFLTGSAYRKDLATFGFKNEAHFKPQTPEQTVAIMESLQKNKANGYLMEDGTIVVGGMEDTLDLSMVVQKVVAETSARSRIISVKESPYGSNDRRTGSSNVPPGGGSAAAGTDPGSSARSPVDGGPLGGVDLAPSADGNPDATSGTDSADGTPGTGTAGAADAGAESSAAGAVGVSPRASFVSSQLDTEGLAADVGVRPTGRVDISPDLDPDIAGRALDIAANDASTSPLNDFEEPTDGQIEGGNYRKGKVRLAGVNVNIETPRGAIRKSRPGAPKWSRKVKHHYGYIPGTRASDGDPVDVFVHSGAHDASKPVFVIRQVDQRTGEFDEPKVMMGYNSEGEAKNAYLSEYPEGWKGFGGITRMDNAQFRDWLSKGENDVPPDPISKTPMLSLRKRETLSIGVGQWANQKNSVKEIAKIAAEFDAEVGEFEADDNRLVVAVRSSQAKDLIRKLRKLETIYEIKKGKRRDEGGSGESGAAREGKRKARPAFVAGPALRQGPGKGGARRVLRGPPWLKAADVGDKTPAFAQNEPHPKAVSVVAIHYSGAEGLSELDPTMAGTGAASRERRRFGMGRFGLSGNPLSRRIYFYAQNGNTLPKSGPAISGTNVYRVRLDNLYDLDSDPLGIVEELEEQGMRENPDALEEAVVESGFDGFTSHDRATDAPFAMLFGIDANVPVESLGSITDAKRTYRGEVSSTEAGGLRGSGGVRGGSGGVSPPTLSLLPSGAAAATAEEGPDEGLKPLEGMPRRVKVDGVVRTFGPFAPAVEVARKYAESSGIPYNRVRTFTPVDEERAKRIADAFDEMPHDPDDPEVKAAYRALIDETLAQWQAIKATGLKVTFISEDSGNPYRSNPRKAILDVVENNHLWVFPTTFGFGMGLTDISGNPLLEMTNEFIDGKQLQANDVFRIVHDYFGHIKEGNGFRADGEENAWRSHSAMYSPLARRAMTTETRGQNSWVNYGPYGEFNRTANGDETKYAEQKIGILPEWVIEEGAADDISFSLNDAIPLILGRNMKFLSESERKAARRGGAKKFVAVWNSLPSVSDFANTALAGQAKRGWYEKSAAAIFATFGFDAVRFSGLLAALSPQTSVQTNLKNALLVWAAWTKAGRPAGRGDIIRVFAKALGGQNDKMDAWTNNTVRMLSATDPESVIISGPKVNSFMLNLRGYVNEVTNDSWMASYAYVSNTIFKGRLNKKGTDPGKVPGYIAYSAKVRAAAAELKKMTGDDWTPAEVQETIWSWAKTAYELAKSTKTTVLDLVRRGAITDELIDATPDFGGLFNEDSYRQIIESAGLVARRGPAIERDAALGRGPRDFAEQASPTPRSVDPRKLEAAARRLDKVRADRIASGKKDVDEDDDIAASLRARDQTDDPTKDDISLSLAPRLQVATGMYSALYDGLKTAPAKMTGAQWSGWIDNAQKKGLFRKEEVDWTGLAGESSSYVSLLDDKVLTREQLMEYVAAHNIKVNSLVLRESSAAADEVGEDYDDDDDDYGTFDRIVDPETLTARFYGRTQFGAAEGFGSLQEPGGQMYRELLLQLPSRSESLQKNMTTQQRQNGSWEVVRIDGALEETFKTKEEADRYVENYAVDVTTLSFGKDFREGHFEASNVVAHVRFNERPIAGGGRMLFVEEVQSDWHKLGRTHGYIGQNDNNERLEKLVKEKAAEIRRLASTNIEWVESQLPLLRRAMEFLNETLVEYSEQLVRSGDLQRVIDSGEEFRKKVPQDILDMVSGTGGVRGSHRFSYLRKLIQQNTVFDGKGTVELVLGGRQANMYAEQREDGNWQVYRKNGGLEKAFRTQEEAVNHIQNYGSIYDRTGVDNLNEAHFKTNRHIGDAETTIANERVNYANADRRARQQVKEDQDTDAVPDAPFKTSWPMLAMKRMLRWAAEHGFKRLAWTTGDMQAKRYNLAKKVSSISIANIVFDEEGKLARGAIVVLNKSGAPVHTERDIDQKRLEELVGKRIADRIMSNPDTISYEGAKHFDVTTPEGAEIHLKHRPDTPVGGHTINFNEDEEFTVGGEKHRNLYDKTLVNEMSKYVKRWGSKVERVSINNDNSYEIMPGTKYLPRFNADGSPNSDFDKKPTAPAFWIKFKNGVKNKDQHGTEIMYDTFEEAAEAARTLSEKMLQKNAAHAIEITDAMRDSILEGQPAFALRQVPGGAEYRAPLERKHPYLKHIDAVIEMWMGEENFRNWFGKSKVAFDDGTPMVYYHGTSQYDLDIFSLDALGRSSSSPTSNLGHFLARDPGIASVYGEHVHPFVLRMENPYTMSDDEFSKLNAGTPDESMKRREVLRALGYDGILIPGSDIAVIFDSNNAKNPIRNSGEFGEGENTRFSVAQRGTRPRMDVASIEALIEATTQNWEGMPKFEVFAHEDDLPSRFQPIVARIGLGRIEGFLHNGTVYMVAANLTDADAVLRVLFEETLGHHGLRFTFKGKAWDNLRDQIYRAVKDSDAAQKIAAEYRDAHPDASEQQFGRIIADEYLAKMQPNQDQSIWDMVVAFVRQWLREHGFVREWSDNDIVDLMMRVHDGIRTGKTPNSLQRLSTALAQAEDTKFVAAVATSAGEGTITYEGDERAISMPDLEATVVDTYTDRPMLQVTRVRAGKKGLRRLARLAAEDGFDGLVIERGLLNEDGLSAFGFGWNKVGDFVEVHFPEDFRLNAVKTQHPAFSLKNRATSTPDVETILHKTVKQSSSELPFFSWMQEKFHNIKAAINLQHLQDMKVGLIDSAAQVDYWERQMFGGHLLDASQSAYKSISLTRNLPNVVAAVSKVGVPVYRNGSFVAEAGRKGLYDILRPLYDTADGKNLAYLWEGYAVARRSQQLIQQTNRDGTSKEKLLSQQEIDKLLELEKTYPQFRKVFDDWQQFNQQLLDLAVDRGVIDAEEAAVWKQNDYVPFYRVLEDEDGGISGPRKKKGFSGQKLSSMRLEGSDKRIQPVLENIVMNTAAILDRVYKNESMTRITDLGVQAGIMEEVPLANEAVKLSNEEIAKQLRKAGLVVGDDQTNPAIAINNRLWNASNNPYAANPRAVSALSPEQLERWQTFFRRVKPVGDDIVSVMINGKPKYYRVTDPLYMRAIVDIETADLGTAIDKIFGGAKGLLTTMVTMDPGFMIANLMRDTLSAWVTSGENFTPLKTALQDTQEIWTQTGVVNNMMLAGGVGGGFYDPTTDVRDVMQRVQPPQGAIVANTGRAMWKAYRKIGMVSEQLNRAAIARRVLERGGSMAEAAYQAQDILNFSQRGDYKAMQIVVRTVPFLNARVQGLHRLWKGMRGLDGADPAKAMTIFAMKGFLLMLSSMLLALRNWDDERYEKVPDDQKDTYWHFFVGDEHFAIPKPFEVGSIFATIPERLVRLVSGQDSGREFKQSMLRTLLDTFTFNPTPQLVKPLIELWANKSTFTQQPIVDQSMQGLIPEAQYNPWTSETARAIGSAFGMSPIKIEFAVRAYLGTLGLYALQISDAAVATTGAFPEAPASKLLGIPGVDSVIGRFYRGDSKLESRNKYADDLYDALGKADDVYRTVNAYLKQGRVADAQDLQRERMPYLQARAALHQFQNAMREINQRQRAIMNSPAGPEIKRAQIDALVLQRNALLEQSRPFIDMIE